MCSRRVAITFLRKGGGGETVSIWFSNEPQSRGPFPKMNRFGQVQSVVHTDRRRSMGRTRTEMVSTRFFSLRLYLLSLRGQVNYGPDTRSSRISSISPSNGVISRQTRTLVELRRFDSTANVANSKDDQMGGISTTVSLGRFPFARQTPAVGQPNKRT